MADYSHPWTVTVRVSMQYQVSEASKYDCIKNQFCYFSTKTYVVGTQKNRLNETILLSTQNICYN